MGGLHYLAGCHIRLERASWQLESCYLSLFDSFVCQWHWLFTLRSAKIATNIIYTYIYNIYLYLYLYMVLLAIHILHASMIEQHAATRWRFHRLAIGPRKCANGWRGRSCNCRVPRRSRWKMPLLAPPLALQASEAAVWVQRRGWFPWKWCGVSMWIIISHV